MNVHDFFPLFAKIPVKSRSPRTAMYHAAVNSALKRIPETSEEGLVIAKERLERAYAWHEGQLAGRAWAAGADFMLADCEAPPPLFYADLTHPSSAGLPPPAAYQPDAERVCPPPLPATAPPLGFFCALSCMNFGDVALNQPSTVFVGWYWAPPPPPLPPAPVCGPRGGLFWVQEGGGRPTRGVRFAERGPRGQGTRLRL